MNTRPLPRSSHGVRPLSSARSQSGNASLRHSADSRRRSGDVRVRGFYSDVLAEDGNLLGDLHTGPRGNQDVLWQVATEKHTPLAESFQYNEVEGHENKLIGASMVHIKEDSIQSDFSLKSFQPKVHLPYFTSPGQCPRKVETERRRRHFAKQSIDKLLETRGIQTAQLMPKQPRGGAIERILLSGIVNDATPFPAFLPLEIFDNTEYDCLSPKEWVALGVENDVRMPVPGKALLPVRDDMRELDPKDPLVEYKWQDVGMLDYNPGTKLYLVQKVNKKGRVVDAGGNPVRNGGLVVDGSHVLSKDQYWVSRIRLMFSAENPEHFADRVAEAYRSRADTEALLRFNLYVDNMPMEGLAELDQASLGRMTERARGPAALSKDRELDDYIQVLEKEIHYEYLRSMNLIIFEKTVKLDPQTFSFVKLPSPVVEYVPDSGRWSGVPKYDFDKAMKDFEQRSLFVRTEACQAIAKVRGECSDLMRKSLFVVVIPKHMKLEEFEQTQSQTTSQVSLFLRDSWITTLRAHIRTSLRDAGKGWFNIYDKNWEGYQQSKLKKLMNYIKYNMEAALRYMVQDSLRNFVGMIVDACQSTLECQDDMAWGEDINNSEYRPLRNPLFYVDLVMDLQGVHYSTNLNTFETSVISLFDKGLQSCQNVPQLEKYVMEELFWSGRNLLLEGVGEHEPFVDQLRDSLQTAITKSLIPMKAYAREYEKHLPLMMLDINTYVQNLEAKKLSAGDIKVEVEHHLEQKQKLEDELPSFVIIGPFYVNTENLRVALSKKCKTLSATVLDLLAKKLRMQAEEVCEEYKAIAKKLYEKPNCIEELTEMREWMKEIPEKLEEFQVLSDKALTDYELLEGFNYSLSNEDFTIKWNTVGWPHKIVQLIEMTTAQYVEEEEKFHKLQTLDQATFNDRIDSLTLSVANIPGLSEIGKAHEYANHCRRLQKDLKDAQADASKYNNRERLFGMPVTSYEKLNRLVKDFEPYRNLWVTTSDWLRWQESWLSDPLSAIDSETVEKNVNDCYKMIFKSARIFQDTPGVIEVALDVKKMIENFRPYIPLIQGLRNPGMRQRHWEQLSEVLGFPLFLKSNLTLTKCLDMKLQEHIEAIAKIAEVAGKEYSIEQALDNMANAWNPVNFEILPYKSTGTYIIKASDDISQLLDDNIVMTQSMSFSPYKKPFEDRISAWESKLRITQDVLDEWLLCQRQWLYLEPIFSSDDIMRQLPVESKRYQTMERMWRKILKNAKENPQVISLCPDNRLLDNLRECNMLIEQVQKGLSEYLETKRNAFPRFYFLSDDELLEILSQTKDPTAVQPHLRKCFENVAKITFESDLKITEMISAEGEVVPFKDRLYPEGNVEDWLLEVERVMKESLRLILKEALEDYQTAKRTDWVLKWPGQLVVAGCQTNWTMEVSEALEKGNLKGYFSKLLSQLDDLRSLVRSPLTKIGRQILSALIVIEVHARDVVTNMIAESVCNVNDFEWISQLRYYWINDFLYIRAVNAEFPYGFEYLGNTGRLVITPLTDRCYLTLTGALHLRFGGAPAGPAGTGKTETTKDLAKAMAIQCVVFNCSDQLDFMAMGKFFKGLASAGAWACFDEFNRIDIEVLSVVAQQITTIQKAQQQRDHYDFGMRAVKSVISAAGNLKRQYPDMNELERFTFEGVELVLKPSCAVFITMNPGYAGRTELPDNLKALFRPVAMMVPDYALIAEISLFSFGFSDARVLAKKIVTTFKLSSEQLSSQDHYDFGMRAVKSVISAAGNLKRQYPDMNEELITLRAIRDVNIPKFLMDDLKLFNGIVSDLFPNIKEEPIDYGALNTSLRQTCAKMKLKDVDGFIHKCIQLYETTVVRHGLMLVGPTGSGKTKCYEVLQGAQSALKGVMSPAGVNFETTYTYILNPKSITMGQLYGEFDLMTHEWTDGILCTLIRIGAAATDEDKRWYMFDGPVDAVWIESMNTVLDDNKKLCLSSGEIIKLTEHMTMMFEVQDLAVASPATVSRCGMVYLEPGILGLSPFVECWLKRLTDNIYPFRQQLQDLFDLFLDDAIDFLRHNLKEIVPSMDSNLTFSLLKMLDCFFKPFGPKDGEKLPPEDRLKRISELIEPWFCFSIVWTIGSTCDNDGRIKFDKWMRKKMAEAKVAMPFPAQGQVYDYKLDDAGISLPLQDDDIEENIKLQKIGWRNWMENLPEFAISADTKFSDIIVPTLDTVRSAFVLELLLTNNRTVLCVGPTGTGKTLALSDKLTKNMPKDFTPEFITFSAKTSANQTQDLIDGKLDKRRKGVYGPPLGKTIIFFIDDLNMPALEVYGAQPPIELIRQWMDFRGWYDRKAIGEFRNMVDVNFVCAMGPPGGGRNPVTPRLMRHFNYLAFTELEDPSKAKIFGTILNGWIHSAPNTSVHGPKIVQTCIEVYNTITTQLLPTPSKSHYTFNLRDLSKVFQGMLMADASKIDTLPDLLRLWFHESQRVFADRLVNDDDRNWFTALLKDQMKTNFDIEMEEVVTSDSLLYADFAGDAFDARPYVEVKDHAKLTKTLSDFLDDYNQVNTAQMHLVLFMDAIKHLCRISRIIRQPLGNALLLGVGGSGRQSLTRLAAHVSEYDLFQIELSKNYGVTEWRDDLKKVMLKAGLENTPVVFLFSDTQIKRESFLEDLNNILNSGDVPNIYVTDELDTIYTAMKPIVQDADLQPTKTNMFSAFTKRVRSNLHTVITMSPIGEIFRARLRQFPALVNCCTIDWFSEWPADALRSVAMRFLSELPELDASDDVLSGLVLMCQEIHSSVAINSKRFMQELNRYNYVTPTSYLELLGIFNKLMTLKTNELRTAKNRTKTGLDKLLNTSEEVVKLQAELERMRPQLEEAVQESKATVVKIEEDTKVAEETKLVVQTEETQAAQKARETQAIADDAQKDLNEALPALDAALVSLKNLKRDDIVEVRAMQRPPEGVKMVIEAVCIMKGIKPKKVPGEKLNEKKDDYWEVGKKDLSDPHKFLEELFTYRKDEITDQIIKNIQPYIESESFTPTAIEKVSKACTSICQWVRAMYKYHFVAKAVAPKREALRIAQEDLAETQRVLDVAKQKLRDVIEGLATLQAKYDECVRKKEELDFKTKECEARLLRADKLIGGLSDEKGRWLETVQRLDKTLDNIVGDILVSAGFVAYLGSFTGEYRVQMVNDWIDALKRHRVPHNEQCTLTETLSDPVRVRSWQIAGLPKDNLSVENGVIVQFTRRWALFIDPQGQANKWIKNLEKENGIDVVKLSDKDFLRSLENAIRFGKPCLLENVGEELDPALEPVLLKQTYRLQGSLVIKLGDAVIPYHEDFKFYITTKLPNPHYTPETSTKVTLVNFTLSPSGLEDQLLGLVVAEERPDLEDAKNHLIVSNAKMKQELKEIEDKILVRLSTSQGSPVDDIDLIQTLEASKIKSQEIKTKVLIAEQTERDIDVTRSQYIPVAVNTQILFFCVADLANIDPMYQYSLEWFISIFLGSISNAEPGENIEKRSKNINNYFTFSLYCNVCRSLFEKHKLLFAFLLCVRILQHQGLIDMDEWRYLLAGGTHKPKDLPNPSPDWISERSWGEILTLPSLPKFASFASEFRQYLRDFKDIFDSTEPHRENLPGAWQDSLTDFQKLLVLRCLRPDKVTNAMQDFVVSHLGQRFIEPQTADLNLVFKDSSATTPLIFILSQGTDPAADLYKFAEEMRFARKLTAISLGQGQGPRAEAMIRESMERGLWVFFQNCHLAPSWMPTLERLIEQINPERVHRDFRIWLTSMPSPKFPVYILQNGSKMTVEPPRGIKANLLKSYGGYNDDFLNSCNQKTLVFKHLLQSLCFFHGVSLERRKFGPLGFNIPYEFTDGDLRICVSQLKMFLMEYSEIPYKVLVYTAGHINYGGRVTDDWDRRCLMNILNDFYCSDVLSNDHSYSPSRTYTQIDAENDQNGYLEYIRTLPINDSPEIFGLHDNANITFAQNETYGMLEALLQLQPKSSSGGGKTREEIMEETARSILAEVPQEIPIEPVIAKFPVLYEQSMNTVLVQEILRYNKLLKVIHGSLNDLLKALKGLVVLSQELEHMANSLYINQVPTMWADKVILDITTRMIFNEFPLYLPTFLPNYLPDYLQAYAYPSLKPLASWVTDLVARMQFMQDWIDHGIPTVFWISGFFFPQAFLTGTLQNYARRKVISIDTISFDFKVMKESYTDLKKRPEDGCYIRGLFVEGARWDAVGHRLTESRQKELYTDMPCIWLIPKANRTTPTTGIYECPVYKTLTRAGTLSTTGHSTNFVFAVEIPSSQLQKHWIKRGVALLCALNY